MNYCIFYKKGYKKMEQSKWIMVRRETAFEKFKRKIKNFIFNFFGIEVINEEKNKINRDKNTTNSNIKNNIKDVNKNDEITIEILLEKQKKYLKKIYLIYIIIMIKYLSNKFTKERGVKKWQQQI